MIIALNIVMAGLVLVGIVTLLARSINTGSEANTATTSVEPATVRGSRARSHRRAVGQRPVGVH